MKFRSIQLSVAALAGACLFVAVGAMTLYALLAFERNQTLVAERTEQLLERHVRERLEAVASSEMLRIRQQLEQPLVVNEQLALLNRQAADVRDGLPQLMVSRDEMLPSRPLALEEQPSCWLRRTGARAPSTGSTASTPTPGCPGTARKGSSFPTGTARLMAALPWTCSAN